MGSFSESVGWAGGARTAEGLKGGLNMVVLWCGSAIALTLLGVVGCSRLLGFAREIVLPFAEARTPQFIAAGWSGTITGGKGLAEDRYGNLPEGEKLEISS
jgi:hypothetical protein